MTDVSQIFQSMEYGEMVDRTDVAAEWLSQKTFGPFVNGKWFLAEDGKNTMVTEVRNPNTEEILTKVTDSTSETVDIALQSSTDAGEVWRKLRPHERDRYLHRISTYLEQDSRLISEIAAVSMGIKKKVTNDWDVPLAANIFTYYAGWALLMNDSTEENEIAGVAAVVTCAACPLSTIALLIAPVLAAGGTVCLKPSHRYPLLAFIFADICVKAGVPDGVINILPGSSDVSDSLVRGTHVKHIGFFGSTFVGKSIRQNVSGSRKTFSMLVDAKSTMIVFDSADIDSATEEAVKAAWFYNAQVPWSVKTLFVQESVFPEVIDKLKSRVLALCTGPSTNMLADIGPIVKKNACDEIAKILNRANARGIEVVEGRHTSGSPTIHYCKPVVLFGPGAEINTVLNDYLSVPAITVIPFRTSKESIALANSSLNGLATSIWTENVTLAYDVAKKLEVGIVWVNCHGDFDAAAPFTARKKSGHGSFCGKEGLLQCVENQGALKSHYVKMDKIICGCISPTAKRNRDDVFSAMNAASAARNSWEQKSYQLKSKILHKMVDLLWSKSNDLKRKLGLTEFEILWYAERITYWASVIGKQKLTSCMRIGDKHVASYKEPVGIIAAVMEHGDEQLGVDTMLSSMCFGNSVLIASCSLLLLELANVLQEAGVSRGVVTVLAGDEVVELLAQHQTVDAFWCSNENDKLMNFLNTATGKGMKRIWSMPRVVLHEMWEFNSTVSKTVWVPAADGV